MFYKVPKALFTEEKYKPVSTDAKMLYGLLLDRMHLPPKTAGRTSVGVSINSLPSKEAQEKLRFGHEKDMQICSRNWSRLT